MAKNYMDYTSVLRMLAGTKIDALRASFYFEDDLTDDFQGPGAFDEMPVRAELIINENDCRVEVMRRDDYKIVVTPGRYVGSEVKPADSLREEFWHEKLDTSEVIQAWRDSLIQLDELAGMPMIDVNGIFGGLHLGALEDQSLIAVLETFRIIATGLPTTDVPTSEWRTSSKLAYCLITELIWNDASYPELQLGNVNLKDFKGRIRFNDLVITRSHLAFTITLEGKCDSVAQEYDKVVVLGLGTGDSSSNVPIDLEFSAFIHLSEHAQENWDERKETVHCVLERMNCESERAEFTYDPALGDPLRLSYDTSHTSIEDLKLTYTLHPENPSDNSFRAAGLVGIRSPFAQVSSKQFGLGDKIRILPTAGGTTLDLRCTDLVLDLEVDLFKNISSHVGEEDTSRGSFRSAYVGVEAEVQTPIVRCGRFSGSLEISHGSFGPNHFRMDFDVSDAGVDQAGITVGHGLVLDITAGRCDAAGSLRHEVWEPGTDSLHLDLLHVTGDEGRAEVGVPSVRRSDGTSPVELRLRDGVEITLQDFLFKGWWATEELYEQRIFAASVLGTFTRAICGEQLTVSDVATLPGAKVIGARLLGLERVLLQGSVSDGRVSGEIDIARTDFSFSNISGLRIPKTRSVMDVTDATLESQATKAVVSLPDGRIVPTIIGLKGSVPNTLIDLDGPTIELRNAGGPYPLRFNANHDPVSPGWIAQFKADQAHLGGTADPRVLDGFLFDVYGRRFAEDLTDPDLRTLLERTLIRLGFSSDLIKEGEPIDTPSKVDAEFCDVALIVLKEMVKQDPSIAANPYAAAIGIYCSLKKAFPDFNDVEIPGLVGFSAELGARIKPKPVKLGGIYEPYCDTTHLAVKIDGGTREVGAYVKYRVTVGLGPFAQTREDEQEVMIPETNISMSIVAKYKVTRKSVTGQVDVVEEDLYFLPPTLPHLPEPEPVSMRDLAEQAEGLDADEETINYVYQMIRDIFAVDRVGDFVRKRLTFPLDIEFLNNWNVQTPQYVMDFKNNHVEVSLEADQNRWNSL
jgi:hypothetical protein